MKRQHSNQLEQMAFSDEDETIQVTPLDVSNPVGQVGVND